MPFALVPLLLAGLSVLPPAWDLGEVQGGHDHREVFAVAGEGVLEIAVRPGFVTEARLLDVGPDGTRSLEVLVTPPDAEGPFVGALVLLRKADRSTVEVRIQGRVVPRPARLEVFLSGDRVTLPPAIETWAREGRLDLRTHDLREPDARAALTAVEARGGQPMRGDLYLIVDGTAIPSGEVASAFLSRLVGGADPSYRGARLALSGTIQALRTATEENGKTRAASSRYTTTVDRAGSTPGPVQRAASERYQAEVRIGPMVSLPDEPGEEGGSAKAPSEPPPPRATAIDLVVVIVGAVVLALAIWSARRR